MLDDLILPDAILNDCWTRLVAAVGDKQSPFHTPAVAIGDERAGATVRTVILRRADSARRALVFHTDRRSPKFASLNNEHKAAWLFYDPSARLQLRLQTSTTLHTTDAVAHEQWIAAPEFTRAMYSATMAPGTPLSAPPDAPTVRLNDGRDNFAVVNCVVGEIDWLLLRHEGHRRLRFTFIGDQMSSTWLAP